MYVYSDCASVRLMTEYPRQVGEGHCFSLNVNMAFVGFSFCSFSPSMPLCIMYINRGYIIFNGI